MKRFWKIGGAALLVLAAVQLGCGTNLSDVAQSGAQKKMEKHLGKKYQQKFTVEDVERVNIGQNFAQYIYKGTAYVTGDASQTFQVTYYSKDKITDNYPMVLYGAQIEADVDALVQRDGVVIDDLKLVYSERTDTFSDFESYRDGHNVIVRGNVDIRTDDYAEGARISYALQDDLYDAGYYYDFQVTVMDKREITIMDDGVTRISEESWMRRFTE